MKAVRCFESVKRSGRGSPRESAVCNRCGLFAFVEQKEAETAAAWFWGESDTVADIRLASTKVLLGRHPRILFLVDVAEIRASEATLATPIDNVEKLLAQYMDAVPEGDVRKWLEKLEAELGNG